jgi:lactoylglutathione lyase
MNTPPKDPSAPPSRTEPQSFRARELMASLTVKDLTKSVDWYERVVGFVVEQRHEHGGKVVAVSLKAGDVSLLLNQDDGAKGWDRVKGEGLSMQFTTAQSIDGLADRIKAQGGKLLSEPADMPWGARVFRVQDPDGFKLAFSS